jgi:hypothetical protein
MINRQGSRFWLPYLGLQSQAQILLRVAGFLRVFLLRPRLFIVMFLRLFLYLWIL